MPVPTLHLFGGANGSGKTTFARAYLTHLAAPVRFLNADEIARGLSPFAPELAAVRAGRLLLQELRACLESRQSFALESTLSGRGYMRMLEEARTAGFSVELNYLWLPSVELAVRRVRQRVRKGGHSVPETDIRRRYARSIEHLIADYLMLADRWWIWDNEQNPATLLADSLNNGSENVSRLFAMKTKALKKAEASRLIKTDEKTRELLAAARRMGRMVREENRRWGLPLIVMRNGKIRNEPP